MAERSYSKKEHLLFEGNDWLRELRNARDEIVNYASAWCDDSCEENEALLFRAVQKLKLVMKNPPDNL